MRRLLHVIVLHVGENPDIARILAQRIARQLAGPWPLEVALVRILLRHPNRIHIKVIAVRLGEPRDRLITPRKPLGAVQPVLEMPDNPIAHPQAQLAEDRKEQRVERHNLAAPHVVARLPAERAVLRQRPRALRDHPRLIRHVLIQALRVLVRLADVVGRRSHHQPRRAVRHLRQKVEARPKPKAAVRPCVPPTRHPQRPPPPKRRRQIVSHSPSSLPTAYQRSIRFRAVDPQPAAIRAPGRKDSA